MPIYREINEQFNKISDSHTHNTRHTLPPNEDTNNEEINVGRQNASYISAAHHHQQEQKDDRHTTISRNEANMVDSTQGEYTNKPNNCCEYTSPGKECLPENSSEKPVMTSHNYDKNKYTDGHGKKIYTQKKRQKGDVPLAKFNQTYVNSVKTMSQKATM